MIKNLASLIITILILQASLQAQQITKEEMLFLTQEWKGERFEDGRPKFPMTF